MSNAPRHIIPISGKDSLATALVQTARRPDLEYEFVFCDTGCELPETYTWLRRVEARLGRPIHRIGVSLATLLQRNNLLFSRQRRYCTRDGKIRPLHRHYQGEGTVYLGLREDEARDVRGLPRGFTPAYPLRAEGDWPGLDLQGVYALLSAHGLLPPAFFWESLWHRVCELHGPSKEWGEGIPDWALRMMFAGRSRSNCHFCFFQRQYEYIWLSEAHPRLFWDTCWTERFAGTTAFSWTGRYWTDELLQRRVEILDRRAREVIRMIEAARVASSEDIQITQSTCGVFCGK